MLSRNYFKAFPLFEKEILKSFSRPAKFFKYIFSNKPIKANMYFPIYKLKLKANNSNTDFVSNFDINT